MMAFIQFCCKRFAKFSQISQIFLSFLTCSELPGPIWMRLDQYANVVDKRLWIYVFGHLNQTEIQTKTKTKTQAGEPARGARSAPA